MLTSVEFKNDLCLFRYSDEIKENQLELTDTEIHDFNFFQSGYYNNNISINILG